MWASGRDALASFQEADPIGHPGALESFVPILGSGHEALADLQEGNYRGAALNGALAVLDAVPMEAAGNAIRKGAWKGGSTTWNATRKWMAGRGYFEPGQHGHHWAVSQDSALARWKPGWFNQPWNIKPMPSPEIHGRIHGPYRGADQFGLLGRYWHGAPGWWKAVNADAGVRAVKSQTDQGRQ